MARTYTVVAGDTLSALAERFYGDASRFPLIAAANKIVNPDMINVGQVLTIPDIEPAAPAVIEPEPAGMARRYTVVEGDTLWDLAQRFYGDPTRYPLIAAANKIANPDLINIGQVLTIPDLNVTSPGPAPRSLLPYASEPFGVYQPLIGWRSRLHQERLARAMANRFKRAANLVRDVTVPTPQRPVPPLREIMVADPTGTEVGRALVARIRADGIGSDKWQTLLADTPDSPLTTIAEQVLTGLRSREDLEEPLPAGPSLQPAGEAVALQPAGEAVALREMVATQISLEAATASLLQHLAATTPNAVQQLFMPKVQPWERAAAAVQFFADQHPAQLFYLSPIGLLHRFREYFFELGTFLGPPVGHVWLSPGGTVELIEVNTRRTLVELFVEQSTQTIKKSELSHTDQDELSDAVKVENANDTKLGITATASGGVASIFQASGSASFNLDVSRKQAQEQTHKRMREQSSKLSSEVRQDYKTTFRTVTETTDTSSRRYVLTNATNRLVSYELSRKMRKVAVQVQDLGQQLCWQLYVDKPGDPLGLGEFVHESAAALDPGIKQPERRPIPGFQEKTYSLNVPFILTHGADSDAENTYTTRPGHPDEGLFDPELFGEDDLVTFKFEFQLPPPPVGCVLSGIGRLNFGGAQVSLAPFDAPGLTPNPNPAKNTFSIRLTHANWQGNKNGIPFEATLIYSPTPEAIKAIEDANAADKKAYDDEVAAKKEQLFYTTLRKRLKLSSQVRKRRSEDLREEERTIIYRAIVSRLYGNETGWTDDDYHVASELIRYFFDIDAMLYFVAPDWWRPRAQPLVSKNSTGMFQPTMFAEPAVGPRLRFSGLGTPTLIPGHRPYYLITEETEPAPLGASLGWLIQLDGDMHRNAFLNSPWVKAVLPIRPGREREAVAWLRRPEVAGTDGLDEPYPFNAEHDPPEYSGLTIEQVMLKIADKIAKEHEESLKPVPVQTGAGNTQMALPTETVFAKGFDPLAGGIQFGKEPFKVFSQWTEILPTDQVVATEYSLKGLG